MLGTTSFRHLGPEVYAIQSNVTLGDRSFQLAAQKSIHALEYVGTFKCHLKTYLFKEAFNYLYFYLYILHLYHSLIIVFHILLTFLNIGLIRFYR